MAFAMPRVFFALALTAAALPAAAQEPEDARLRQAWSYLTEEEQADVASWFRSEVEKLDTFQSRLLRAVLASEPRDPGLFPEDSALEWYDPEKTAPKQPIARRKLPADDARAQRTREAFREHQPAQDVPSLWRYDWGRREIVRTGDLQSAQHVFDGALAGFAPQVDFAQALVERALDDGKQQAIQAAF